MYPTLKTISYPMAHPASFLLKLFLTYPQYTTEKIRVATIASASNVRVLIRGMCICGSIIKNYSLPFYCLQYSAYATNRKDRLHWEAVRFQACFMYYMIASISSITVEKTSLSVLLYSAETRTPFQRLISLR